METTKENLLQIFVPGLSTPKDRNLAAPTNLSERRLGLVSYFTSVAVVTKSSLVCFTITYCLALLFSVSCILWSCYEVVDAHLD